MPSSSTGCDYFSFTEMVSEINECSKSGAFATCQIRVRLDELEKRNERGDNAFGASPSALPSAESPQSISAFRKWKSRDFEGIDRRRRRRKEPKSTSSHPVGRIPRAFPS